MTKKRIFISYLMSQVTLFQTLRMIMLHLHMAKLLSGNTVIPYKFYFSVIIVFLSPYSSKKLDRVSICNAILVKQVALI